MKTKCLLIISFLFLFIPFINAEENYYQTITNSYTIKDLDSTNNSFYLLTEDNSNTIVYKYNLEGQEKGSKTFSDLTNSSILATRTNYYLVGNQNGFIAIYILDDNLKIIDQKDTTIPIRTNDTINIYNYDSKIYLLLLNNNNLSDNNLYEFQSDLSYTDNKISSYGTDNLKSILKGDYLIFQNDSLTKNITKSLFYQDYYYVLAIENNNITFTKTNNTIEESIPNITNLNDFTILNNNLYILDSSYTPLKYDLSGNKQSSNYSEVANTNVTNAYIHQIGNYLAYVYNYESSSNIYLYTYDLNIISENNPLGTITIPKTAYPNEQVTYQVIANNGYAISSVVITDEYGNSISTSNNTFTMPSKAVYVTVNYVEKVTNPETVDIIFFIIIGLAISISILYLAYRKFQWLK